MENNLYTLITGATGGLGQAFCNEFANRGHNLFLTSTNQERLDELKQKLQSSHPNIKIETLACDLSISQDINNLTNHILSNFKLNFIVSNAGYITEGSIQNSPLDTLLTCIDVNCKGSVQLIKNLVDKKDPNHKLNIITIASMAANYPMPYMAIYAATKAFLKNFMLAMRAEYKKQNVNILIVEPGAIATSSEMKAAIKAQGLKGKLSATPPEKIAKKAYKKSLKNKARYIPGFFNKLTLFFSALLPTALKTKFISKMWKKSQQKRGIQ